MSRLADIVAAVVADFPTTDPPVNFAVGARFLTDHRNWPRIVAHVASSSFGPNPGGSYRRDGGTSDRQFCVRQLEVDWEIWGGEYADAESLLHALVACLYRVLGDSEISLAFRGEQWLSEDGAKWHGGHAVVLKTTIKVPVLDSDRNVVLTAIEPGAGYPTTEPTSVLTNARVTTIDGEIVGTTVDEDITD